MMMMRSTKDLESRFRGKNTLFTFKALSDHETQRNFMQYFPGKSESYRLENFVIWSNVY
jgi:hypothetical protein